MRRKEQIYCKSKIYILKKAFDALYKAKLFHKQRYKEMDEKRRKLKEELEEREKMAFNYKQDIKTKEDAIRIFENAVYFRIVV